MASTTEAPSPWWTASLESNLLALSLTRITPPPVSTFDAIDSKFKIFEKTYNDLLEILRRVRKTVDVLDNLNYCSLHQTLDEYDDFKYDADVLRKSPGASGGAELFKRTVELPTPIGYQIPRYVYNDNGIRQLESKIDWQIRIMKATMSDIVLRYLLQVHKQSNVRPGGKEHESGLLASTLNVSPNHQATSENIHQYDDDDNILHLFDRVERLNNRLTRTSPRVEFPMDYSDSRLNSEEIERVISPLKAQFQSNKSDMSGEFIRSFDEKRLAEYSQQFLRHLQRLQREFPKFITRKRVYFEPESEINSQMPPNSIRSHTNDKMSVASINIQQFHVPEPRVFNPTIIDVVSDNGQKFIVSTDGPKRVGIFHPLPHRNITYPTTSHRKVAPLTHDTGSGAGEECMLYLTGNEHRTIPSALPIYNFPSSSDMMGFQCALRDKLIRHTFDTDSIHSKGGPRGLKTSFEHMKLWSDFNGKNYTLSFFIQRENRLGTHLEYPVECFDPEPRPHLNKPGFVRLDFRLPLELPKGSQGSTSSIASSGMGKNKQQRLSFSKSQPSSSEISQTPSPSRKRFSWKRNSSDDSTPPSGPTSMSQNRSSASSASMKSQLSPDTGAESRSNTTATTHRFVHPDAKELMYLDIEFSSVAHAELFIVEFPAATRPKFRGNSIFTATKEHAMSPILGPDLAHSLKHSPEALTPAGTGRRLSLVPVLDGIPPPIIDQVPPVVGVLGKPLDNSSHSDDGENGPRAFSNTLMNELIMAQKSQALNRRPVFPHRINHGTSLASASRQDTGFSSGTGRSASSPSVHDYNVGWICAIETEYVVAQELLDEEFLRPSGLSIRDKNPYAFGRIGNHHVVIGCLPMGRYGLTSATAAAKDMLRSFENIHIGLMVGIGGGAPSSKHDIRLGDVVVSSPGHQSGGVVHYDSGKAIQNHEFERTGSLGPPSKLLLGSLQDLKTSHSRHRHRIPETISAMLKKNEHLRKKYQRPDPSHDILYNSSFIHKYDDRKCSDICIQNADEIVPRPERDPDECDPVVHYGLIASADRLMKDAVLRDQLARKLDVLCFEMEAAGLMDEFECVVIRGICDYSDTHKNDIWQGYAAATAAAYAKELLGVIPRNMETQERASSAEGSPELHAEPWT